MLKAIVSCLTAVCAVAIAAAPAAAIKRCPPVPAQLTGTPSCKCTVQNYGTTTDFGVKITVYDQTGEIADCTYTLPAKHGNLCHVAIPAGGLCGCMVTGEGTTSLVSLSVTDGVTFAPQAAVECK